MSLDEMFKKAEKEEEKEQETEQEIDTDSEEMKTDDSQIVEQKDEQQIEDEIKGKVIEDYIYDFSHKGRRIVGLSYAGVITVARKQGNLRIVDIKIEETEDKYIVKAKGRDELRNFEIFGVASQPKTVESKYGTKTQDPFALVKAVAKAQRNVLRRLIPESVINAMVYEYKVKQSGSSD